VDVTKRQAGRPHHARRSRSSKATGLDADEFADELNIKNIGG
jgi:hypothetical protein